MDDVLMVRGFERFNDLIRDGQCFIERYRAARNSLREVFALDELHDQKDRMGRKGRLDKKGGIGGKGRQLPFLKSVNRRDMRVIERRENVCLALKPGEAFRVGGKRIRQELQRDVATE